jgi:O-antigen/teichoic acid export membrane protein
VSEERFAFPRGELRRRTARGVLVNGTFVVVAESLTVLQGLLVARLLSTSQFGLYGIVSVTVVTLLTLKQIGIDEAYVQQDEADQKLAFHRAFTIEVSLAVLLALLIVVLAPIVSLVYGESQLLPLMLALAYLPLAFALQSPGWVFFRRMDFLRQRGLQAIVPLVSFPVTIGLVLAGLGAWGLVLGAFVGNALAAIAALRLSPYRLRLDVDRATVKRYVRFSWPILAITAAGLVIRQGQVLAFDIHLGLAGASYIVLAATLTQYADRADQIVTATIYPAICAVKESQSALVEIFSKSNRLTAIWALLFGVGLALFAPDLVHHVVGDKWEPAIPLLQALGITTAVHQIGFNWTAFYRAIAKSEPQAVFALTALVSYLVVPIPLLFAFGIKGFAWGMFAVMAATGLVRAFYVKRLLPEVGLTAFLARVSAPPVLAAAPVLLWRVLDGGARDVATSIAQLVTFLACYALVTWLVERDLLREVVGYLSRPARAGVAAADRALA